MSPHLHDDWAWKIYLISSNYVHLLVGCRKVGSPREAPHQWVEVKRESDGLRSLWICAVVGRLENEQEACLVALSQLWPKDEKGPAWTRSHSYTLQHTGLHWLSSSHGDAFVVIKTTPRLETGDDRDGVGEGEEQACPEPWGEKTAQPVTRDPRGRSWAANTLSCKFLKNTVERCSLRVWGWAFA